MLNQLVLVGRITHEPEPLILEDGKKVLKFQLAVQRSFKNYNGEYDTDFISVTAWEGLASTVKSYTSKGVMLAVKGRIQSWQYKLPDDKKLGMIEVIAEKITFLSSSKQKLEKELEE
ncbi:single-stranded DNA-binding protein [Haploplasma modicum]|jgi:single-strand DNA-binding protein|uniref:single-stranded DNA-binding protein n=1 Tax=Haploplasma modicum TaxID=2150 RepID=UPI00047E604C|nr:single-stranded DNA-binding protein [Haploplasma modicum]MCR1809265.1 single-stranded DNA-binding protein [Haploplasma modicum]